MLACIKILHKPFQICLRTKSKSVFVNVNKNLTYYQFRHNIGNGIHTTSQKLALPPQFILFLKPILRASSIIFGRIIRKAWSKLSPESKAKIITRIKARQTHIAATFTAISGIGIIYYLEHIEEEPITKRKRFVILNNEQMLAISDVAFNEEISKYQTEIMPINHPIYKLVSNVANRLLQANADLKEIKERKWAITIINRPDLVNAFVLPNGKIVLFTGVINLASNEDELAIVMSHEISHALLQHTKELLSQALAVEVILLIPIVIIWTLLPALAAFFSDRLTSSLADIMVTLPYSRALEMEADVVGLKLAARACFDVREAPTFWGKMAEVAGSDADIEWLSTHPSSKARQAELWKLLPEAINIRELCNCPRLPPLRNAPALPTTKFYPLTVQKPTLNT